MAFKDYWTENGYDTSSYNGVRPGHDVSEGPAFSNAVAYIKIDNLEEAAVRIKELGQVACTGLQILLNFDKVIEIMVCYDCFYCARNCFCFMARNATYE